MIPPDCEGEDKDDGKRIRSAL